MNDDLKVSIPVRGSFLKPLREQCRVFNIEEARKLLKRIHEAEEAGYKLWYEEYVARQRLTEIIKENE